MVAYWVLVVDDEPLIRWSLREQLEEHGYGVLEAATAGQARERLDRSFDVALVDQRLPDETGLAFARELRRRHPACPVILMTAYAPPEAASGVVDRVVEKPFDIGALVRLVRESLCPEGRAIAPLRLTESRP